MSTKTVTIPDDATEKRFREYEELETARRQVRLGMSSTTQKWYTLTLRDVLIKAGIISGRRHINK